jgi:hypothetical protein
VARGNGRDEASERRGEPGPATPPRFFDLLRVLSEDGVSFVLIGGFAVTLHGYVRATKDIDIIPDPGAENMGRLWDALSAVKARPAEFGDFDPKEMPVPFTREGVVKGRGNWICYTTLGRLDIMSYVETADGELLYAELRENAERVDLEEIGRPIWVASVDDLIAMKEHANRDIDRIDLTAMRMARGEES